MVELVVDSIEQLRDPEHIDTWSSSSRCVSKFCARECSIINEFGDDFGWSIQTRGDEENVPTNIFEDTFFY